MEKLMGEKALLPSGRSAPRIRNEDGLLPTQVSYLKELAESIDPREAAKNAKVTLRRVRDWLRKDSAFKAVHEELFAGAMEAFKQESQLWADAAQDEAWKLMEAMKPLQVTLNCMKCGTKNTTFVEVRDTAARIRLIELAMKLAGRLTDVRKHQVEGEITHLTADQKVALMALKLGKEISTQMMETLENLGLIPDEFKQDEGIIT